MREDDHEKGHVCFLEIQKPSGNGNIHPVLPQSLSFPTTIRSSSIHSGDLWEGQSQLEIWGFFWGAELKVAWRVADGVLLSPVGPMESASGSSCKTYQKTSCTVPSPLATNTPC